MHRSLLILLVLIAMLSQSATFALAGLPPDLVNDPEHAALHLHDHAHTHHDDGSIDLDDSDEARLHVLCDNACATAALPREALRAPTAQVSVAPRGWHDALPAPPYLEGPLRPPRHRS